MRAKQSLTRCLLLASIVPALLFAAPAQANYHKCGGLYTGAKAVALSKITAQQVSCSTARKTTKALGTAWADADYRNVVRFTRIHRWRCVYRFALVVDASYGRVLCSALSGRRVAFRVMS